MTEPRWDDHADWWQREFTDGVDPEYVEQIIPLALEYLERLEAPRKEAIWFEESAHFPFFEEPEEFAAELRRVVEKTTGRD